MKFLSRLNRYDFGLLLVVALVIIWQVAQAAGTTATVTITWPTAYVDDSALPMSAIQKAVIVWRRPGSTAVAGTVDLTPPSTSIQVQNLICGDFVFQASAVLKTGNRSDESQPPAPYSTGVSCSNPKPPGVGVS